MNGLSMRGPTEPTLELVRELELELRELVVITLLELAVVVTLLELGAMLLDELRELEVTAMLLDVVGTLELLGRELLDGTVLTELLAPTIP
jgi:hypothetical protein